MKKYKISMPAFYLEEDEDGKVAGYDDVEEFLLENGYYLDTLDIEEITDGEE